MPSGNRTKISPPTEVQSRMILSPLFSRNNPAYTSSKKTFSIQTPLKTLRQTPLNSPSISPLLSISNLSSNLNIRKKDTKTISSDSSTPAKSKVQSKQQVSTPSNLADLLSLKLSLESETPERKHSKITSKPSDMNTPEFKTYQKENYPDDSTPSTKSNPFLDEEDLINRITQLAIQSKTPLRNSPRYHRRISLTPSLKSAVKRAGNSGILNSPNRWQKKKSAYDRFIPNRTAMDMTTTQLNLSRSMVSADNTTASLPTCSFGFDVLDPAARDNPETAAYQDEIAKACGLILDQKILSFHSSKPPREIQHSKLSRPLRPKTVAAKRKIATAPEKILDAPGIADDFYLNLLDWSSNNVLAVGLGNAVFLWDAASGSVNELCSIEDERGIASISWSQDGSYLAVGDFSGKTQLWDVESESRLRTLSDRQTRIGNLSWNRELLSTGSQEGFISNHDVRLPRSITGQFNGHQGDVCGLKWNSDGSQLASGGNDNLVNIWDIRSSQPKFTKRDHTGAVKALSWCPWHSNLLASGGGTDDGKIMFWNTMSGQRNSVIETGSQITGLIWSKVYREIISSHGFSDNQLAIWKYSTLKKVVEIPHAHQSRILHTAISPDGQVICSGAADENLKFWRVFAFDSKNMKLKNGKKNDEKEKNSPGFTGNLNIR